MTTYDVSVYLSEDFRLTCMGYDPEAEYREALSLTVAAESVTEALEMAYRVTNSTVEEMFCPEEFTAAVAQYRRARNRSLSVGDVCDIDGIRYAVALIGFEEVG